MITIDGSVGEGGGQILRTALGLSLVSGKPFSIQNIRAKRKKPGLMRQHLTAVRAAAEIGSAQVKGDQTGSTELHFTPGEIKAGSYHFAIGTAGSCTLVLQTVLPALLVAGKKSTVTLEGGTHNQMAPPYDFLAASFVPVLNTMGAGIETELERPGFYPAGGGKMMVSVSPEETLKPFHLDTLTDINIRCRAICAQLPYHIGKREVQVIQDKLKLADDCVEVAELDRQGPGNIVSIFVRSAQLTETFIGFGQKHLNAEKVALAAVRQVREYFRADAPVGPYLADQLLIPMALTGGGSFITSKPTNHTLTNIQTIGLFLDANFALEQIAPRQWRISL